MLTGGTLFSGIGAPECAAPDIDWRWCAEIDGFASAVHKARFPGVPNLGDVNEIEPDAVEPVDLVVFGSPCQSFSVAGKRLGLDDPRGNLALVALRLVSKIRPHWMLFENVPGLLSNDGGRDFGAFLGLLGECGYGWAYRVLDAQFAGVPQRRRRVFVVGCLGDWRGAAAVLFEPSSLRGDPAPRREAGEKSTLPSRSTAGGGLGTDFGCDGGLIAFDARNSTAGDVVMTVQAHGEERGWSLNCMPLIAGCLQERDHKGADSDAGEDGTGRGTPLTLAIRGRGDSHDLEYRDDGIANAILTPNGGRAGIGCGAVAFDTTQITSRLNRSQPKAGDPCHPLAAGAHPPAIAYGGNNFSGSIDVATALSTDGPKPGGAMVFDPTARQPGWGIDKPLKTDGPLAVASGMSVRRLTPTEAERLMGFPDHWTLITWRSKPAADGPRYRSLGNSMAVPVVRWVLRRVAAFEAMS